MPYLIIALFLFEPLSSLVAGQFSWTETVNGFRWKLQIFLLFVLGALFFKWR